MPRLVTFLSYPDRDVRDWQELTYWDIDSPFPRACHGRLGVKLSSLSMTLWTSLLPTSNGRIWRWTFSTACSTSKAVCPADEARALMELKKTRYINQQERTTPHKIRKIPYSFIGSCPLLFQTVTDSIKIPFLARARPNSAGPIHAHGCITHSLSGIFCSSPARHMTPMMTMTWRRLSLLRRKLLAVHQISWESTLIKVTMRLGETDCV